MKYLWSVHTLWLSSLVILLACSVFQGPILAPTASPPPTLVPNALPLALLELEVAAGKPTSTSGYWIDSLRHAYPSSGLVDRQIVEPEGCEPGPTTYWLLPDHELGWAQIDLQQTFTIVKLRWLNTHNGRCGHDRATTKFHIALSTTGEFAGEESLVHSGTMAYSTSPDYEQLSLVPPIQARYVRFYVDDYYSWGGGLNELEVYAAVLLP